MKTPVLARWLAGFVCAFGTSLGAPVDVTSRTEITTANVRSTLNRDSGQITSSADITIKNIGDRPLEAPLHVALFFTPESGSLDGMQVPGSLGGIGAPPYQTFFFDLSASVGAGLAPQASTTLPLRFTPPKGTRVTFRIVPHATVDADPVARAGGPYQARAGIEVVFDGSSSSDPEGGALSFEWNFGDGSPTAPGAIARHSFSAPGLYEATLSVRDARNHLTIVRVPVAISPAADFAVARVRTLDGAGLPLGGVAIEERRNDQPRNLSSTSGGFAPLGNGIGSYRWKFSKPGYLPVWRQGELLVNQAAIIANPRLPKENGQKSNLSPLNDALLISPSQNVRALFNAGAFPQGGEGAITDLSAQTLPFPLPLGWSPIAQFHLALTEPPAEAGAATMSLPEALGSGQQAALVLYNAPAQRWEVRALVAGNGTTSVGGELLAGGSYALVLPDPAPFIPPSAEIGQPLIGTTQAFEVRNVTATGSVTPDVAPASREAAAVTASARVVFSNAQPLPSGLFFPTRVTEKYALVNERTARTPDYDTTVFAYQRPGSGLGAEFPMRPQLLFGPEELREATVKCEVLEPGGFKGGVIDNTGGVLGGDGIRVTVPAGAVAQAQPAELTSLDPQPFAAGLPPGVTAIKAFSINLQELAEGKALSIAIEGLEPSALYVLGLAVSDSAGPGVTPLERFVADASGKLSSTEPSSGPRLPGARGAGDYVLLKLNAPQALVQGMARDSGGNAAAGLAIRSISQPWLVFSQSDGAYTTLAATGAVVLSVFDPRDGNEGSAALTINDPQQPQNIDLAAAPTGPRVVIVEPPVDPKPEATQVRTVTPVVVRFSEAITGASFGSDGIALTKSAGGSALEGTLSLNVARTEGTLLPANPLEADTAYTITVSDTIRDGQNLAIQGNRVFTFTTAKPPVRDAGAQLVIYQPDAQNIPAAVTSQLVGYNAAAGLSHVVAHGSQGTADPGVPVILVNESTGETSTVLSKADGSFFGFIRAEENDFVTATFVNTNGTRVAVPASRQQFDDGRVGLYAQGGILEAESDGGPVKVLIQPSAIKSRNVFKVESLALPQLLALLNNTLPQNAQLLAGVRVTVEGDQIQGDSEMSFPLDPSRLQLRPGAVPEDGAFALTVSREVEGQKVFQVVDKMRYEDGQLFTNTQPFEGPFGPVSPEGLAASFGGLPGAIASGVFSLVVMPLFLGEKAITVTGQVAQLPQSTVSAVELSLFAEIFLQIVSPIDATAEDAALAFGQMKAVSGALVSFFDKGNIGTVLPGRIQPGLVCAVSDRMGCYSLIMPAFSGGGSLVGTHPRLGRAVTPISFPRLGVGTSGRLRKNVIFPTPDNEFFNTAPKLSVGHTPLYPVPGGTATVDLRVLSKGPAVIIAVVDEVVSLVPGVTATTGDVTIGSAQITNPGPGQTRWRAPVTCTKAAIVKLKLTASTEGNTEATTITEVIEFGGIEPVAQNPIDAADSNDREGPTVVGSFPVIGDTLPPGQPIIIQFSEPVDKAILTDNAAISVDASLGGKPVLDLSPDQQTLTIHLGALPDVPTVTVTVGTSVKDIVKPPNGFDQHPAQAGPQSHSITLRPGRLNFQDLPNITSGGGTVFAGNHLFVLDRAGEGALKVFNIGAPSQFSLTKEVPLPGPPRDLVFIPQYSFVPKLGAPAVTRDLLVVVGGNLGAVTSEEKSTVGSFGEFVGVKDSDTNITFQGQYLRVFDVSDPANPVRVASPRITLRESAVTKVRWQAPLLAYLESGADTQFIGLVDLQELLIGFSLTGAELANVENILPLGGRRGTDLNADGDYVDAGETLPLPAADATEFFGFRGALQPTETTTQRIEDFAFEAGILGVTLSKGFKLNANGTPTTEAVVPQYRTVLSGSGELSSIVGAWPYGLTARPKRVTILSGVNLKFNGVTQVRNIALVSLSPDTDGVSKLSIVDISNVVEPLELRRIRFAPELGLGLLQTAIMRPDGLIALATTTDVVLLDPAQLTAANPPDGTLHPAIRGIFRGAGSGNFSAGESASGLRAIALGGRNRLIQPPPEFRFVFFPLAADVVKDPGALKNNLPLRDDLLRKMQVVTNVRPSRLRGGAGAVSSVDPPSPAAHYHVLVRVHGGAGPSIPLALEALNEAGYPVENKGAGFPPVRAADPATIGAIRQNPVAGLDAPIPKLRAFQLSADPKKEEFHLYLSEPIALVRERISAADLTVLDQNFAKPRAILWSEDKLRVTIDPLAAAQPVVGPFAAETDGADRMLRSRASGIALTLPGGYILGPNPPPIGGEMAVPGSFGLIDVASGEFRHTTVDIELPSRRMPIRFQRTVNNQDTCHSAFGNGFDFFYNQRLIELRPDQLLPGSMSPTIVRSDAQKSVIAESGDVEFRDGAGRMIIFKKQQGVPQAFSADPLITELAWPIATGTCYLPHENEKGVFDLLFRFPSGEFARLTPDGTQYWYQKNGRLSRIYDRFPANHHVLEYSDRGELRRIIDRSVTADRFLEIGYYRGQGASDFISQLDEQTQDDAVVGKIARLKDFAERDVKFSYSVKGLLEEREGIEVSGATPPRILTRYVREPATQFVTGLVTGNGAGGGGGGANGGTALFSSTTAANQSGGLVANGGSATGTPVSINVPVNNSAATAGGQTGTSSTAEGAATDVQFDDFRYPKSIRMSGPGAPVATTTPTFNSAGLLENVEYPLGTSVEYAYNLINPILRARPNVTQIKKKGGGRGGGDLTADFAYDERYNLPSGQQTDFNGKNNTVTLRGDGREIASISFDGAGTQTFVHDDTTGQLKEEVSPEAVRNAFDYDNSTGFLTTFTRGTLAPTTYGYGGGVPGKLGRPDTITPPRGAAWTSITYDALLQITGLTRGGMQEQRAYDENGNITFLSRNLGDGRTYAEDRVYGQNNFLSSITIRDVEVNGTSTNLTTLFEPDDVFRIKKVTYPDGVKTREYTYDHLGNVLTTKVGQYEESYTRDLHGNLLELRVGGDLIREMRYDGHDRMIGLTNKTGNGADHVMTIDYFGGGQLKKITVGSGNDIDFERTITNVDGLGRPLGDDTVATAGSAGRTMTYSAGGGQFVTTITGPLDEVKITTDNAGRRTGLKTGLANVTFGLDANDNIEHIESDEGGPLTFTQDFTYDNLDHALTEMDGVGARATYAPRLDGYIKSVTDARQNTTTFDYSVLGELLTRTRPAQGPIEFKYQFDENRLPRAMLDKTTAGNRIEYDDSFRRTKVEFRNGSSVSTTAWDPRQQVTDATIPSGDLTASYDLQSRLTSQTVNYGDGVGYEIKDVVFDSLSRIRSLKYGINGNHTATFTYDKLGPVRSANYQEPGGPFPISMTIYSDGMRETTTYPSGIVVEDGREPNGRINRVTVAGADVWHTAIFHGSNLPGETDRGPGLREINTYDLRRRLLSRRFERTTGGAIVEELRFDYDDTDNLVARQFLGRGGRADFFDYDAVHRVTRAEIGARPSFGSTIRLSSSELNGGGTLEPGLFARNYGYDSGGLDLLVSAGLVNPSGLAPQAQPGNPPGAVVPAFMQSLAAHDSYLHALQLDGANRGGPDAQGNVKATTLVVRPAGAGEPAKLQASLIKYDGLNHLASIALPGGITIEYEHQVNGLMHHKTVRQGGSVITDRAFVWDDGRLIEERDIRNGSDVVGRFYYADRDFPVAADLKDPTTGQVRRVHYLCDNVASVIAVADNNGNIIERVSYDAWGQPLIETTDVAPPRIAKIRAEANGDLFFHFSEPVLPPVQAVSTGIAGSAQGLGTLITITANGLPVSGSIAYFEDAPGAPFGSVVRFRPSGAMSGTATAQIAGARLFDEWGNANLAEGPSFPVGVTGDVFTGSLSDTSAPRAARSAIGNPFLFHGQYFDYDAGLSYMRARFYDPYTGQFLQRDSQAYEDSVNLYAAFRNGPLSWRDPYGTSANKGLTEGLAQIGKWLDEIVDGGKADTKITTSAAAKNLARQTAPTRVEGGVRGVKAMSPRARKLADQETHDLAQKAMKEVAEQAEKNRIANEAAQAMANEVTKVSPPKINDTELAKFGFSAEAIADLRAGKPAKFLMPNPGAADTIGFARIQQGRLQVEVLSIENIGSSNALLPRLMAQVNEVGRTFGVKEVELIAGQVEESSGRLAKLLTHAVEGKRDWGKMARRMGIDRPFRQLTGNEKPLSEIAGETTAGKPSFSLMLKLP